MRACAEGGSVSGVVPELENREARDSREPTVVGDEGGAAEAKCGGELEGVRRLHSKGGAQLGGRSKQWAVKINETDSTGPRQTGLVSVREVSVSRSERNDKSFQKCHA